MDKYVELATRQGLSGLEALEFASKQYEKDQEREERKLTREREREEKELEREEREKERQFEIEKLRLLDGSMASNGTRTSKKLPKLPPFEENGDMDIYLTRFERIAQSNNWNREDWAVSLSALLTGKALEVYHRLSADEADDYEILKEALLKRYGLTADGFRRRLRESPPEEDETPEQYITRLSTYLDKWMSLSEFPTSFDGLKQLTLIEQFLSSCPKELELFLKRNGHKTLEEISSAAEQYLTASGQTLHGLRATEKEAIQKRSWKTSTQPTTTMLPSAAALQVSARAQKCAFCTLGHETAQCRKAEALSVDERRRRLLAVGACFICLGPHHIARTCNNVKCCERCGKRHHRLLCTEEEAAPIVTAQSQVEEKEQVLFQTARAVAVGPAGKRNVRIILDTGSNQSFISTSLSRDLKCQRLGTQRRTISTFGGDRITHKTMNSVSIKLMNCSDPTKSVTLTAAETEQICGPVNVKSVDLNDYPHLKHLTLADCPSRWQSGDIDILIGMDHYQDVVNGQVKTGERGPMAWETIFGWVLGGRAAADGTAANGQVLFLHTGTLREDIEQLWALETIGIEPPTFPSKVSETQADKNKAVEHFERTCTRDADGRYQVRWPAKTDFDELPTNKDVAHRRLERCETSLDRSGKRQEYDQAIRQYIEMGFAEPAPVVPDGPVHYLSHHAVYKGDKIRIVFDASAGSPRSLNDMLLPGPNMIADLTGILIRFRLNMVAVSADIEKAFLQLALHHQDRDLTRFLWRTPDGEVTTYRMTRVVFGVASSPFLLQAVIRRHLEGQPDELRDTADRLKRDVYCDDLLTSMATESEAKVFAQEAKEVFSTAKMNLTKWRSNRSIDVAGSSDTAKRASEPGILLTTSDGEPTKVLGVRWVPHEDQLIFQSKDLYDLGMQLRPTKRNVLRLSARVYDPLGLISAFTMRCKMLLKELWTLGTAWDEDLPLSSRRSWLEWLNGLRSLEALRIPRPYVSNNVEKFTIHTFCDASKTAYAAAVYLRTCGKTSPETRLIMSKSRLSPSKPMAIPRLELMAAVLGSRLTAYVIESLPSKPQDVLLWTDSAVALAWIRSDPGRWGAFVSNRVTEVQQMFPPAKWRHCPGECNPADLPSRGASADKLGEPFWQEGPSWLREEREEWPPQRAYEPSECRAEERKSGPVITMCSSASQEPGVGSLMSAENYSSRKRLHRVTAWMLRFLANTRKTEPSTTGDLTAEELNRAEELWILETQKTAYGPEREVLIADQAVPRTSHIYELNPYLENGILRARGRLQESKLNEDEKHPILLPNDDHYVRLLIQERHVELCHAGVQQTMYSIRDRFWIPKGRQTIRKVIRACPRCRIFHAEPFTQETAPLPRERASSGTPFSQLGVDLGGPIFAKDGGNIVKTYFVIFTCAVVRAVHIELVKGLSTRDFLQAFDRFAARRGMPKTVTSDNATNFKGAAAHLAHSGVTWKFNAPRAPWWGGFYERLVRTTKEALRRTLHKSMLSFEDLQTLLCRIEGAINARPLSALSEDIDDLRSLSPRDFLQVPALDEPDVPGLIEPESQSRVLRKRWIHCREVLAHLWKRWHTEYLRELRIPPREERSNPAIGDLVIIRENPYQSRSLWPMGRIVELHPGRDGLTRVATLRRADGTTSTRPVQRLHRLECG
ncbi:uncharacterized protein LOC122371441 [Amphibalanus amphitrite]|uniref:uncharacterized protein LOC122371441 n=1 Tax=Amphibalanus amphitrite TaxID=1232801 RepID=UPI001C9182C1|nr:uncharacterized protein LOC122371441 [Amphibalanus amphitrite]